MTNSKNGLRGLPTREPVLHVEVVNQHVLEDATACAQVLQGRQRVVPAARLHDLQLPNNACVELALQGGKVPVASALVATDEGQVVLQRQVDCLLHLAGGVGDGLLGEDGLLCLERLDDEGEVRVRRRGDDDDVHRRVRERLLEGRGPPAVHALGDARCAGLVNVDHPGELGHFGQAPDGGQMEVARSAQADQGNTEPLGRSTRR
mmetsp:Transcript_108435/g.302396  ORF Transcript_108435/g.302396 Transcript_108435/m.302396 type:complete len:205 (-) Transcript_108435:80-694(-)